MDGTAKITTTARSMDRAFNTLSMLFLNVEHLILVALGLVLSVAAVVALGGSVETLWDAVVTSGGAKELLHVVDRLLFVLMIAEILHTVRVSLQSGALTCEPFLTVGLIASIRRVLVITLESSQYTPGKTMNTGDAEVFRASMIELGVLAGLILVMVVSIYMLRRSRTDKAAAASI